MARTRATAVSAIILALGLAGAGATPFIVQSASASVQFDPVEPCDPEVLACDVNDPETTVTITTTVEATPDPEEPDGTPETTVTKTVTATPPKPSKSPTPTKTTSAPVVPPPSTEDNPQPLPTQSAEVPPVTSTSPTAEESVEMPAIAPSDTPTPEASPSQTQAASSEEVPLELRRAAPEFDQTDLTRKLSIPALVLVLLALFAVLIFEGRLRRMAHAAAVRKAGPAPMGGPETHHPAAGYPAGPGYATAGGFPAPQYPGGTAYAPIISFVPVQTYPSAPPQYGYPEPAHPYPPQGYAEEPPPTEPEPVVLSPDEFDSFSEPPKPRDRDPFEPVLQPEPVPADIPPGGSGPYDDGADRPLGPASPPSLASAAEAGDQDPWKPEQPGSLFKPAKDYEPAGDYDPEREYEPAPYLPMDEDVTAVQPLPEPHEPQEQPEPTKELPDATRRRFGRKKK